MAVAAATKAILDEGGAAGHSIHSWRCEYPDRYGECGCVEVTARAALVAARPYLMPTREEIAEVLAIRWTQPLDLMNRREDWTYPERPMSERINSEVDASYRSGPPEDSSLVLRAPTCLEIADAVLALLNGES